MDFFLAVFIPALAAALVMPAMSLLKKLELGWLKIGAWLDAQNPWLQRLVVAMISWGAMWAFAKLGLPVPEQVFQMDGTTVESILTALFAFLYHKIKKDSE